MATSVRTSLGRLGVRQIGSGPTAVLWHSLFVDSRSWGAVAETLAHHRTVITIDGPSHGASEALARDFSYDACVRAAGEALDALGVEDPVDWVGNAWGGHVGILLAATQPRRVGTLTTIGTPVPALGVRFRWTKAWPLVQLYRISGPTRFLCAALSDALLGADAVAAEPDRAAVVMDAFRRADRRGMFHAARSMMLTRPSLADRLPGISVPTLMLAARDDATDWPPSAAQGACATMPNARAAVVAGVGHVAPLLLDAERIAHTVLEFWADVGSSAN